MWGFVGDKAALGQVFSEYFGFHYQSSFRQFLHHTYSWLAVVAAVPIATNSNSTSTIPI
jgi:hypothetical protein